jgi:hypothetical protein
LVSTRLAAKVESEEATLRLAVLIDADNAQAAVIEGLLAEIARFGEATVKRIYGDFTQVGHSSEESVVGLGRLLRVSRQSVLRGVTLGKQVIIRNGWEAKSFW